jgi:hypothetical protein
MLVLWLMPQVLQDKPDVFQHVGRGPSHIHSETTFLNSDGSAKREVHFLASAISRSDPSPLDFFLWSFLKDKVYVPPVIITLKNLKDRMRTATAQTG